MNTEHIWHILSHSHNYSCFTFPYPPLTDNSTLQPPVPLATTSFRRSSIHATPTPAPATTYARSTGKAALMKSTVSHTSVCQVRPTAAGCPSLNTAVGQSTWVCCVLCVCVFSGCKLGEASEFLVQQDARIQVPTRTGPAGCYEVCTCGPSGRLENCVEMPCVDTNKPCIVGGQRKSKAAVISVCMCKEFTKAIFSDTTREVLLLLCEPPLLNWGYSMSYMIIH